MTDHAEDGLGQVPEGRVAEFQALREEKLYTLRSRVWGVLSYCAIAGGLLGFVGPDERSLAAMFVAVLALPFMLYTMFLERMRLRIGAYILSVLEQDVPGLSYERALSQWRDNKVGRPYRNPRIGRALYILALYGAYDVIAGCSLCLALRYYPAWWLYGAAAAVGAFLIIQHLWLNRVLDGEKRDRDIFHDMGLHAH